VYFHREHVIVNDVIVPGAVDTSSFTNNFFGNLRHNMQKKCSPVGSSERNDSNFHFNTED